MLPTAATRVSWKAASGPLAPGLAQWETLLLRGRHCLGKKDVTSQEPQVPGPQSCRRHRLLRASGERARGRHSVVTLPRHVTAPLSPPHRACSLQVALSLCSVRVSHRRSPGHPLGPQEYQRLGSRGTRCRGCGQQWCREAPLALADCPSLLISSCRCSSPRGRPLS